MINYLKEKAKSTMTYRHLRKLAITLTRQGAFFPFTRKAFLEDDNNVSFLTKSKLGALIKNTSLFVERILRDCLNGVKYAITMAVKIIIGAANDIAQGAGKIIFGAVDFAEWAIFGVYNGMPKFRKSDNSKEAGPADQLRKESDEGFNNQNSNFQQNDFDGQTLPPSSTYLPGSGSTRLSRSTYLANPGSSSSSSSSSDSKYPRP